jgi:ubiquinone/menaquinone biosynthesis C-methylase UbiE
VLGLRAIVPTVGTAPRVVDSGTDAQFREAALADGLDPDAHFVGGYVDHEWRHARPILLAYVGSLQGKEVLEFGCHLGATAIICATLGALVTGVDIDSAVLGLARLNADRFGLSNRILFQHVEDTRYLPFGSEQFDLVTCNSVLEYVPHRQLREILREIDRVLRPGGVVAILSTSSRLAPREVHSHKLLVNWIPRALDRFLPAGKIRRGLWPWELRAGFAGYEDLTAADWGAAYVAAKREAGFSPMRLRVLAMANRLLAPVGFHAGVATASFSMMLRKPARG